MQVSEEDALSEMICNGLGGKKNISDVDCCATRLRCTVFDPKLVNEGMLKGTGASGVIKKGEGVQVIYGPRVSVIKSNLEDYLETAPNEVYTGVTTESKQEMEQSGDAKESESTEKADVNAKVATEGEKTTEVTPVKTVIISSPVQGVAADLSTAPDEAFAGKMMGDGAVVTPTEGTVVAPEDGEVVFVFDTKHAIGFVTDSGISLLLHMGIDTVKLGGEGFEVLVENGQKVKKGDVLMKMDLNYLKEHAPSVTSPILCTELEDNQKIRLLKEGKIQAGEALFAIDSFE